MSTPSQPPSSPTGVSYLFGHPIAHSLSPLLHQTVYNSLGLNYSAQFFESKDLEAFLALLHDPKCFGAAVTMPHKLAILPHLDDLTPEARTVGACNTVFVRPADSTTPPSQHSRRYIGTNTDVVGIREAFLQNIPAPETLLFNRPGAVIGGGGAARSAVYALAKWFACPRIYLVNRDAAEVAAVIAGCAAQGFGGELVHVSSVAQAEALTEGPGAVVGCVPDFAPVTEGEREARAVATVLFGKRHKGAFLEMAYHPSVHTALGGIAEAKGWRVVLGTEAMIWQGLEQDRLWLGKELHELPVEHVKAVIKDALQRHG